jgi:hypothetical protein
VNVTVKIFYSDNEFAPALYFCDYAAAWQLWFTLTKAMASGESGPHVVKVEIWDGGEKLILDHGLNGMISQMHQQYRKD